MEATKTPAPAAKEAMPREAFPITPRMRLGSLVAMTCAGLLMLGLIGAQIAIGGENTDSVFYLATKTSGFEVEAVGPGWGYVVGPLLILGAIVPLVRSRDFLYKDEYRANLVRAIVLWVLGLLVAVGYLIYLVSNDYEIKTGTPVAFVLLIAGLLATIEVWPFHGRLVRVDPAGNVVEEPSRPPSPAA
jgi:hypothetical protein